MTTLPEAVRDLRDAIIRLKRAVFWTLVIIAFGVGLVLGIIVGGSE